MTEEITSVRNEELGVEEHRKLIVKISDEVNGLLKDDEDKIDLKFAEGYITGQQDLARTEHGMEFDEGELLEEMYEWMEGVIQKGLKKGVLKKEMFSEELKKDLSYCFDMRILDKEGNVTREIKFLKGR